MSIHSLWLARAAALEVTTAKRMAADGYERAEEIAWIEALRFFLHWLREEQARAYTCTDCGARRDCEYSFDPYNTDGDCLVDK